MVEFSRVQLPLLAAPQLPRAFGVCFGHVRVVVQGTRGEAASVQVHGVGAGAESPWRGKGGVTTPRLDSGRNISKGKREKKEILERFK